MTPVTVHFPPTIFFFIFFRPWYDLHPAVTIADLALVQVYTYIFSGRMEVLFCIYVRHNDGNGMKPFFAGLDPIIPNRNTVGRLRFRDVSILKEQRAVENNGHFRSILS